MTINKGTRLAALYTFCAHYHAGQWSRGYRLLCRSGKAWKRHAGINPRLDYWERQIERFPDGELATEYKRLIWKWASLV